MPTVLPVGRRGFDQGVWKCVKCFTSTSSSVTSGGELGISDGSERARKGDWIEELTLTNLQQRKQSGILTISHVPAAEEREQAYSS